MSPFEKQALAAESPANAQRRSARENRSKAHRLEKAGYLDLARIYRQEASRHGLAAVRIDRERGESIVSRRWP